MVNIANVSQVNQEVSVMKTPEAVRVKGHFRHSVSHLKKLGVPANSSIQVRNSDSAR